MYRTIFPAVALAVLLIIPVASCAENVAVSGSVEGRVVDYPGRQPLDPLQGRGKPVPGALVTLADAITGQTVAIATADAKGEFHFTVPPGDYWLTTARSRSHIHVEAGKRIWVKLGSPTNM